MRTQEEWNALRQPCIIMSRCCGWLVDRNAGNPGKQQEWRDRLPYKPDFNKLNKEYATV